MLIPSNAVPTDILINVLPLRWNWSRFGYFFRFGYRFFSIFRHRCQVQPIWWADIDMAFHHYAKAHNILRFFYDFASWIYIFFFYPFLIYCERKRLKRSKTFFSFTLSIWLLFWLSENGLFRLFSSKHITIKSILKIM